MSVRFPVIDGDNVREDVEARVGMKGGRITVRTSSVAPSGQTTVTITLSEPSASLLGARFAPRISLRTGDC